MMGRDREKNLRGLVRITFYYLQSVVRTPVVVLAFLFESSAGPIFRTCSVCPGTKGRDLARVS
jgi:hypothetical protein